MIPERRVHAQLCIAPAFGVLFENAVVVLVATVPGQIAANQKSVRFLFGDAFDQPLAHLRVSRPRFRRIGESSISIGDNHWGSRQLRVGNSEVWGGGACVYSRRKENEQSNTSQIQS